MNRLIHDRLPAFLRNLDRLDASGQRDAVVNEVLETFGWMTPPAGDCTHQWELDLHGIAASGASEEEAIANWKRLARQHMRATDHRRDCPYNGQGVAP
ncbi:hypothetical protein [Pukyongiella litopenaei]|uniref:Uncharacterized protein n=1 Tax=Pukyongiella litopenaei TaxID=2605946 RepID=A0A2S0ML57_9RHOB|nr:hypothetical protein [Pukyongiella litopenaei]AVO36618.1 hypothetical protein C6Y53_02160 [Pukyongiella litopenaei]